MSDLLHDLSWSSRLSSSSSCSSTAAFVDSSAARLSALPHCAMSEHSSAFSLSVPPQHSVSRLQSFDALLSSLSASNCLSRLPSFSALSSYAPLPLDDSAPFDFHLADEFSYGRVEYGLERTPAAPRSISYESDGSSGESLPPLSPHSTDSYNDSTSSASSASSQHSPPPAVFHQQRAYPITDVSTFQQTQAMQQQQPYYTTFKQPLPTYQPQLALLQVQSMDQWAPRSTAGWYESGGSAVESVPVLPLPATGAVHYSFSNNYSVVDDDEDSVLEHSDSDSEQQEMQSNKRRQREDDYTLSPTSVASSPAVRTRSQTGGRRDNMLSHVLKQEGRRRGQQYDRPMDGEGEAETLTHPAGSYSPSSFNDRGSSIISYSPSSASASAPSSPFTFSPSQSNSPRSLLLSLAQHARSSHNMSTPTSASSTSSSSIPHRFASYTATASSLLPGLDPNEVVIGIYTRAERAAKIARYREKRASRQWKKKIMYDCRKSFADNRPRVGGRFIKMKDESDKPAVKEIKKEGNRMGEERKDAERRESKRSRR